MAITLSTSAASPALAKKPGSCSQFWRMIPAMIRKRKRSERILTGFSLFAAKVGAYLRTTMPMVTGTIVITRS